MRVIIVLLVSLVWLGRAAQELEQPIADMRQSARDVRAGLFEIPFSGFPPYGVPSGNHHFPSYYERAMFTWYNTVRTGPRQFRDTWMQPMMQDSSLSNVFASNSYPANIPVTWNLNLNRLARAHSDDRITCPSSSQGGHVDCNGTSTDVRISKFYSTGAWAEIYSPCSWVNILSPPGKAYAIRFPLVSIVRWICDGLFWSSGQLSGCVRDKSGGDGHRAAIMETTHEVGCGFGYNAAWTHAISTCNRGQGQKYNTSVLITSGAHVCTAAASSPECFFLANYRGTATPNAKVFVDGVPQSMAVQSTYNGHMGTYKSSAFSYTGSDVCRSYYFVIGGYRYPEVGVYKTFGVGTCEEDYSASTPVPPASSPAPPSEPEDSSPPVVHSSGEGEHSSEEGRHSSGEVEGSLSGFDSSASTGSCLLAIVACFAMFLL